MNMRVLVIGGTSGIGASIVKVFEDNGREGQLTVDQIAYATDKLALVTARRHLQKLPRQMKIIGICPATVDTKYNASKNER